MVVVSQIKEEDFFKNVKLRGKLSWQNTDQNRLLSFSFCFPYEDRQSGTHYVPVRW